MALNRELSRSSPRPRRISSGYVGVGRDAILPAEASFQGHRAVDVPKNVVFSYWGRRGLTRFALQAATATKANPHIDATFSVSRQNESFGAFTELGVALLPVDTFASDIGSLTQSWRIPSLRQGLTRHIRGRRTSAVIELMPHVWSSFVMPAAQAAGARYATIIHDAVTHPGDHRSFSIGGLVSRSIAQADVVLTLSEAVAGRLAASGVPRAKLCTLFHPDLDFAPPQVRTAPLSAGPIRLAFMGRIMRYKGLPLFVDMIQRLRDEGIAVAAGVFGEGELGDCGGRLRELGAEVVNRWLTEAEISDVLQRYHALVLSHVEASQSGVAATALGAGLPVIATPVGGLVEQVSDGATGVLAVRADAPALAEAAKRLLLDPEFYRGVCRYIAMSREQRSMTRFVDACLSRVL